MLIKIGYPHLIHGHNFRSCLLPLCENESSCEITHMKMCSTDIFMQIKLISYENFARGLVLKQRYKVIGNGLFHRAFSRFSRNL